MHVTLRCWHWIYTKSRFLNLPGAALFFLAFRQIVQCCNLSLKFPKQYVFLQQSRVICDVRILWSIERNVLPGGKSILAANMLSKSTRSGFSRKQFSRQFPHGKQVRFLPFATIQCKICGVVLIIMWLYLHLSNKQTLLEHLEPGQSGRRTPIDWNYSTSSPNNFHDSYNSATYNGSARSERRALESRGNNQQQQQQSSRRAQTAPNTRRPLVWDYLAFRFFECSCDGAPGLCLLM